MVMRIDKKMIEQVYIYSRKNYKKEIEIDDAVEYLVKKHRWTKGSAKDYIRNYNHIRNGEEYKRTMNGTATEYYLENIFKDDGYNALQIALKSVKLHIDYQENIQPINNIKKIYDNLKKIKDIEDNYKDYNDEPEKFYSEGKAKQVLVNIYERDKEARKKCLEYYGYKCFICGLVLANIYGEIAEDFIHVHHIIELSAIKKEYKVDPINDLRPLCPNCHAIIHRKSPALGIDELIELIKKHT
jgi:5-methylcytosine-specific restriction protein A